VAVGQPGMQHLWPLGTVMIPQPVGAVDGQAADSKIQAEQIIRAKAQLNQILGDHTKMSPEQIREDSERDKYFSAEEAKEYGLVDRILERPGSSK